MNRRSALLLFGVAAGCVVELLFAVELVRRGFVEEQIPANYVTLTFAITVASLLVGAAVGVRVPSSVVGPLLVAAGVGVAIGSCRFSAHPMVAALGFAVACATALLPLHAAVCHGGGISSRARRGMIGAHATLTVLGLVTVWTAAAGTLDRWFIAMGPSSYSYIDSDPRIYARNPLLFADAPGIARASWIAGWVVLLVAGIAVLTERWLRFRSAPSRVRRREAPVIAGATAWVIATAGAAGTVLVERTDGARAGIADFGAIILPVLALALVAATIGWVELIRPRLGRVSSGAVELASIQPSDAAALRSLLGDVFASPNVDVVYSRDDVWVDGYGKHFDLEADRRRVTFVRSDGDAIAAVLHDPDVPVDAIELGARLTGAQMQAQRAAALARSRADAVREATGRLVRSGDRASTRIEAELAAGPLATLMTVSRGLRDGTCTVEAAAAALRLVTADVRKFSHGLFPRDLEDRGLAGVMNNKGVPTRRLPAATEMTCYLLAHDDATAAFTDEGDRVVVARSARLTEEMIERVEALGGTIDDTVARVPVEA